MADARYLPAGERREYYFEEGCYIIEYLNDAADPGVSIARARVPAGTTTRDHYLLATTERYHILSGTGRVHVGDTPAIAVAAGDTIVIPPGVRQRADADAAADLIFLAICSPRFRPENYRSA